VNRYLELTKPRITLFILMSTGVGFLFGTHLGKPWTWMELFHTLLGTMLIAGGTAALNQWYEREGDGLMNRTKARPIPSGRSRRIARSSLAPVFPRSVSLSCGSASIC